VLTYNLSEPLNGATTAGIVINADDGNLTIDRLNHGGQVLALGALQYFEKKGLPTRTLNANNEHAELTLRGPSTARPWLRMPWSACNEALEWQIQLNPMVSFDITARSGGGNVTLNLTDMLVTSVLADTGGGNVEVILPDNMVQLKIVARSGAGNVAVQIPGGIEARIQATSGLGKLIVDPRFDRINGDTYQSPDYERASSRVEITAHTGVGNVSVSSRI
jgi:hypothetical protein